jgi:hypothetical protein
MGLLLIGVIFLIGGGLRMAQLFQQWSASRHWQITTGTVTRSELNRVSPRSEPDEITMFEPNIIYTYNVGERHYRGDVTDQDVGLVNLARGEQLMADFAKDNEITVHFDPYEPWQSSLFLGPTDLRRQAFYAGVGITIGVVSLIFWLL